MPITFIGGYPQYISAGALAEQIRGSSWPAAEHSNVLGTILAENRGLFSVENWGPQSLIPINARADDGGLGLLQHTPRVWSNSFGPKSYPEAQFADPYTNLEVGYQIWNQPGIYGGWSNPQHTNWSTWPSGHAAQYRPYAEQIFGYNQPQALQYESAPMAPAYNPQPPMQQGYSNEWIYGDIGGSQYFSPSGYGAWNPTPLYAQQFPYNNGLYSTPSGNYSAAGLALSTQYNY